MRRSGHVVLAAGAHERGLGRAPPQGVRGGAGADAGGGDASPAFRSARVDIYTLYDTLYILYTICTIYYYIYYIYYILYYIYYILYSILYSI